MFLICICKKKEYTSPFSVFENELIMYDLIFNFIDKFSFKYSVYLLYKRAEFYRGQKETLIILNHCSGLEVISIFWLYLPFMCIKINLKAFASRSEQKWEKICHRKLVWSFLLGLLAILSLLLMAQWDK